MQCLFHVDYAVEYPNLMHAAYVASVAYAGNPFHAFDTVRVVHAVMNDKTCLYHPKIHRYEGPFNQTVNTAAALTSLAGYYNLIA